MHRIWLGPRGRLAAVVLAVLGTALPAGAADDAALRRRALALNDITGEDPLNGQYRALLADTDGTKPLLATALAMTKDKDQPFNYNAAFILARVAEESKDLKAGRAFYRICIDQAVKLQSGERLAQAYGGLIELLYNHKRFEESAKVCQELLEMKTDDGKPRLVLVATDTLLGEPDFVELETYDSARRLKPAVHRLMIQAVARQGKYEAALKLVDNLIKARPDNWLDRQLKGWVQREAGQYAEAAKTYEDVLERVTKDKTLKPEEQDIYTERYRYYLSNIYVELNQIDKASEQLKALLDKKPDDPGYNNDLGYIWADHDRNLDEAEKLIRKALEEDRKKRKQIPDLKPEEDRDNGAYLDSLGWVLFKQKKYKEAKESLLKAVEDKDSQHLEIFDHLGDVHLALGEKAEALAAWKKGLELAGTSKRDQQRKAEVEKKIKEHQ
jgi:tetratricopeptide (TPR) repeat protein